MRKAAAHKWVLWILLVAWVFIVRCLGGCSAGTEEEVKVRDLEFTVVGDGELPSELMGTIERHDDVAAGGYQQALEGVGQGAQAVQPLEEDEGGGDNAVVHKPAEGGFVDPFHGRLTLSRARICP